MPDHFHIISKSEKLKKAIRSLKSYSAKEITDILRSGINFKILDELRNAKNKNIKQNLKPGLGNEGSVINCIPKLGRLCENELQEINVWMEK